MGPIEEADQIPTTEDRDPSPPTKLKKNAFLPPFTSNELKSNEPIGQSLPLLFGPKKLLKVLIEEPYIPVRIEETNNQLAYILNCKTAPSG